MFYEEHPEKYQPVERVVTSSPFRFTRESIARGLDAAKPDPEGFHGPRIALATPDMPPMGLHVERIEGGTKTRRHRSTANTVFLVLDGSGTTTIGERDFSWRKGDAFAAPTWTKMRAQHCQRCAAVHTLRRTVDAVLTLLPLRSRPVRAQDTTS